MLAQDSLTTIPKSGGPLAVEFLIGIQSTAARLTAYKKMKSVPGLVYLTATNVWGSWKDSENFKLMHQSYIGYEVLKNLSANIGFHVTPETGFRPSFSISKTYKYKDLSVNIIPRIDIYKSSNVEVMGLLEYKPYLIENWKLYIRVIGLYGENIKSGDHSRSYCYGRLGLNYKDLVFGLGYNFDRYGPKKNTINYGGLFLGFLW